MSLEAENCTKNANIEHEPIKVAEKNDGKFATIVVKLLFIIKILLNPLILLKCSDQFTVEIQKEWKYQCYFNLLK